jgi:predicted KAP-like P-loop ATPase
MKREEESSTQPRVLSSDRPLEDPADDLFGLAPFAEALATSLLRECPADGLVIGIYGAWGTGKSTALNFLARYLVDLAEDGPPILLRFNPWWFSGQEDLLRHFFALFESAVLKARATRTKLKRKLAAFGSVFGAAAAELPVPGARAIARGVEQASASSQLADVVSLKAELVAELRKAVLKVVIIVDDIDRLTADEARQMFRLIKAVADFPNVIYVLAFDRDMTATALEHFHPSGGQNYLDKIIQVPFELPLPDREQLNQMLFRLLERVFDDLALADFDQQRWIEVFTESIQPFITKPRDVVRLANTLSVTYAAVKGEVNPIDFIAVEALRVLEPQVYAVIRDNPDQFTGMHNPDGIRGAERTKEAKAFHESWMKDFGARENVIRDAVQALFPRLKAMWTKTFESTQSWRMELRVCSSEIFPIYFRLSVSPHSISRREFGAILETADATPAFQARLLALVEQKRPDTTSRARVFISQLNEFVRAPKPIREDATTNMMAAFANVGDDLVRLEGPRRGFDLGIEFEIGQALRNLLAQVPAASRLAVLSEHCEHGRAIEALANFVSVLAGEHGRHGEDPAPPDKRSLEEKEVEALEGVIGARLAQLAATDGIWGANSPIRLLYVWRHFQGATPVASWASALNDADLLRMLYSFTGRAISPRPGRIVSLDPRHIDFFFERPALLTRVRAMLRSKPSGDQKQVLEMVAKALA